MKNEKDRYPQNSIFSGLYVTQIQKSAPFRFTYANMGTADNNTCLREVCRGCAVFNSWLYWERKWICGKILKNVPVTCYNFNWGADAYRQPTAPQNKSLLNIKAS
jgi:hypothetical protein